VTLPARLGGLGFLDLLLNAEQEHKASLRVMAPLRQLLNDQDQLYSYEVLTGQMTAKSDIQRERRETLLQTATSLRSVPGLRACQSGSMVSIYTRVPLLMP